MIYNIQEIIYTNVRLYPSIYYIYNTLYNMNEISRNGQQNLWKQQMEPCRRLYIHALIQRRYISICIYTEKSYIKSCTCPWYNIFAVSFRKEEDIYIFGIYEIEYSCFDLCL